MTLTTEQLLKNRSNSLCELCGSTDTLDVYQVSPNSNATLDDSVLLCSTCRNQINHPDTVEVNHWRCLNDSMWSQTPAVQVIAWRMLTRLSCEGWPQELLDMLYLDDETLKWAQTASVEKIDEDGIKHLDSNGAELKAGDTVILTKDLNVKGANFIAKRGKTVRNISLVIENAEQIEAKVNGQRIVILTKFVKKV